MYVRTYVLPQVRSNHLILAAELLGISLVQGRMVEGRIRYCFPMYVRLYVFPVKNEEQRGCIRMCELHYFSDASTNGLVGQYGLVSLHLLGGWCTCVDEYPNAEALMEWMA